MTEEQIRYTATITIRLPDVEQLAIVSVTLLPPDAIPANGRCKRLRDCTLAELQAYAEEWETAVWETYQAIKLDDLAADEQVDVDIAVAGGEDELPDWLADAIILPTETETPATEEPEVPSTQPDDEDTVDPEAMIDLAPVTEDIEETAESTTDPSTGEDETDTQPPPSSKKVKALH